MIFGGQPIGQRCGRLRINCRIIQAEHGNAAGHEGSDDQQETAAGHCLPLCIKLQRRKRGHALANVPKPPATHERPCNAGVDKIWTIL